ncbi:MAG: hypothetical protein J2P23_00585 [Microlunatus sp.]|nr:hypothetical protein [Microlunatus sp.]
MSDDDNEPPLPWSEITAEQLLTRLLELIKGSTSAADLTFERVRESLGVPLRRTPPDLWGASAQLTPDWTYAIIGQEDSPSGQGMRLTFFDSDDRPSADMGSICQLDFDDFTGALRSAGFEKTSIYGSRGELVYDDYKRDQLRVEVSPRGESGSSTAKKLHLCVRSVMVE